MAGTTSDGFGKNGNSPDRLSFSLSDPQSYAAALDWIRDNVVLNGGVKGPVLEIAVSLPECDVSVFMRPKDHYILAFRGADKVYLLDDDTAEDFKKVLQPRVKPVEVEILKGLGAGHGVTGLATFTLKDGAVNAQVFRRQDLASLKYLACYSRDAGIHFQQLQKPLSLIVCMISESARIPMMGRDFINMYYGCDVIADEAIRSYGDAKAMMRLAIKKFSEYPNRLAIEKLAKRADEMSTLLQRVEAAVNAKARGDLISMLVRGRLPATDASVQDKAQRFRDMCTQLKFTEPQDVQRFLSAFSNASAVRAAKQGVAYPNIST